MHKPSKSPLNRRQFLKTMLAGVLAAAAGSTLPRGAGAQLDPPRPVYLPLVGKGVADRPGVIQVHAPTVTDWEFDREQYYGRTQAPGASGVSQAVVDAMLDRGVTALLGLPVSAVAEAWRRLTPDYTAGGCIVIKINLNNATECDSNVDDIDAIAQPLNALVRGLVLRGVRQQDIVVYDAIRCFPDRLYAELAYPGIQIHDRGCRGFQATFNSSDPDARVQFFPPDGYQPSVRLCDTLVEAQYLINMPILKGHPLAGVTLGFKNHFGSTNNPSGMHAITRTSYNHIDHYNGLVDLFSNPHIRYKTVLTLADGIYGSRQYQNTPPQPWTTFGGASPCSLFLSRDPVAIDCVMHDLLKVERGADQPSTSGEYLRLASAAGLGTFESGDPWQLPYGSGYARINYRRIEM